MKNYLTFLAFIALLTFPAFGQDISEMANIQWNKELEVKTGEVLFDDRSYYAYTIEIYDTDDRFVEKLWKDQLKNISDKVKRNIAYGAFLSIHDEPLDMHVLIVENKKGNFVSKSAAFLDNGTPINPEDYPEAHQKAKEMMHDMAVQMNKAVVQEQTEEATKELEKMQKDLEKLRKDHVKLHETIVKNQRDLEKGQKDEKELEKDIRTEEKDIERLEEKAGEERSLDELKKLEKMHRNLARLQDKLNRVKSDQIKYGQNIRDAEREIPRNEQEQVAKEKEVAAQEAKLNQLHSIYQQIS